MTAELPNYNELLEDASGRLKSEADGRFDERELHVYTFPQTWPSTALGFGGVGGAAMTRAQTTVVMVRRNQRAVVYFAGRYAYTAIVSRTFMNALSCQRLADCRDAAEDYDLIDAFST